MMLFKKRKKLININSYINGRLITLEEIPDKVFSTRAMGDGFAIIANDNILRSPSDGIINFIAPTNHAIGIKLKNDVQVLIHIGLDSATTQVDNFKLKINQGQEVKSGEELIEMDDKLLKNILYIPLIIIENPNNSQYHFTELNIEEIYGKKVIWFD